ncbi:TPA: RidA family protein [Klebsiella aerogenes]
MKKNIVETHNAPQAIGPYSQGISYGDFVFTSGQLPLDPTTAVLPAGGIKEQTRQSLLNVQAVLEQSGASMKSVIKTTCFLANMEDFAEFNAVYSEFFDAETAPARSCIQAAKLPRDALVEIEAIAHKL